MKPLVVIPARRGSKGIPGKNLKLLGGKPLIEYTIQAARDIFLDSQICVSTDDDNIIKITKNLGLEVHFKRPIELATDTSDINDVLKHALEFYETELNYYPDTLILLQPTSPFRTSLHIEEALKLLNDNCEMVVSVKESKANPYFVLREENNEGWLVKSKEGNFSRRQDCPKVWELNGALYIMQVDSFRKSEIHDLNNVKKYVMDEINSVDIDTYFDWQIAETILKTIK